MKNDNKEYIDTSIFKPEIEEMLKFEKELYNIKKLYNWLTTACLAIMAFFITILIQIKLNSSIEHKTLLSCAFLFMILSLLQSTTLRFGFELSKWAKITADFINTFKTFYQKMGKEIGEYSKKDEDICKKIDIVSKEFEDKGREINPIYDTTSLLINLATFSLGLILTLTYLLIYIFS